MELPPAPLKFRARLAQILRSLLPVTVAVLLLAWLARQLGGFTQLREPLQQARGGWMVGGACALVLALCAAVLRWRLVLRAMGHGLSFREAFATVLGAMPPSIVLPSRANDLLRARAIRDRVPIFATIGSVLAERAIDVQSLCLLAAIGASWSGYPWIAAGAALAMGGEWIAVGLLLRWGHALAGKLGAKRDKALHALSAFEALRQRPWQLLAVVFTSVGAWLCNVALMYCLCRSFGAELAWIDVLALWPLALFMGLLPVTFGGFGTRDAAFTVLTMQLVATPMPRAPLLAATLTYGLCTTALLAIVGLPFMIAQWGRR